MFGKLIFSREIFLVYKTRLVSHEAISVEIDSNFNVEISTAETEHNKYL